MAVRPETIAFIADKEGFSPTPYWDNNHYSIGYGTYATADEVRNGTAITREEAARRLATEAERADAFVSATFPRINDDQRTALTSLVYNVGPGAIGSGLVAAVNAGDTALAQRYINMYNNSSNPADRAGLTARRNAEANVFGGGGIAQNMTGQSVPFSGTPDALGFPHPQIAATNVDAPWQTAAAGGGLTQPTTQMPQPMLRGDIPGGWQNALAASMGAPIGGPNPRPSNLMDAYREGSTPGYVWRPGMPAATPIPQTREGGFGVAPSVFGWNYGDQPNFGAAQPQAALTTGVTPQTPAASALAAFMAQNGYAQADIDRAVAANNGAWSNSSTYTSGLAGADYVAPTLSPLFDTYAGGPNFGPTASDFAYSNTPQYAGWGPASTPAFPPLANSGLDYGFDLTPSLGSFDQGANPSQWATNPSNTPFAQTDPELGWGSGTTPFVAPQPVSDFGWSYGDQPNYGTAAQPPLPVAPVPVSSFGWDYGMMPNFGTGDTPLSPAASNPYALGAADWADAYQPQPQSAVWTPPDISSATTPMPHLMPNRPATPPSVAFQQPAYSAPNPATPAASNVPASGTLNVTEMAAENPAEAAAMFGYDYGSGPGWTDPTQFLPDKDAIAASERYYVPQG